MSREKYDVLPVDCTEYNDLGTLLAAARDRMDALEGEGIPFEIIDLSPRGELGIKTEHRQDNYVLSLCGVRVYNDAKRISRKKRLWGGIVGYVSPPSWYNSGLPRMSAVMPFGLTGQAEVSHDGALRLYRLDSLPEDYLPDDPTPTNIGTLSDLFALGFDHDDVAHLRERGPLGRSLANGITGVIEIFLGIGGDRFLWSKAIHVAK